MTGDSQAPTTYTVGHESGEYIFVGGDLTEPTANPEIQATVGETIDFDVSASGHPFWIKDEQSLGTGPSDAIWANTLELNGAEAGRIRVRFNQPGVYYYNCQYHPSMAGRIVVS